MPLLSAGTYAELRDAAAGHAASILTAFPDDVAGLGRILRDEDFQLRGIREDRDCSEEERAIDEINPSVYAFRGPVLAQALPRVGSANAKGEIYLTDVFSLLLADESDGRLAAPAVEVVPAVPPEEVLSVNDPVQLAEVDRILRSRASAEGARS